MTIFAALPVLALVLRTPAHPTTRAPAPAMQLEALDVVQTGGAAVLAAFTFKEVSSWSKATGELKKAKAELARREKEIAEAKVELEQLRAVKASMPEDEVSRRQFGVVAAASVPLVVGYFLGLSITDGEEIKATRLAKVEAQKAASFAKSSELARAREAKEAAKREEAALVARANAEQKAAQQAAREVAALAKQEKLAALIGRANKVESGAVSPAN